MTAKTYRKLPVVIEAVRLDWTTWNDVCDFIPKDYFVKGVYVNPEDHTKWSDDPIRFVNGQEYSGDIIGVLIKTLEGVMLSVQGDYIIKGVRGEIYSCKGDIFEETYEEYPRTELVGEVYEKMPGAKIIGEGLRIGG